MKLVVSLIVGAIATVALGLLDKFTSESGHIMSHPIHVLWLAGFYILVSWGVFKKIKKMEDETKDGDEANAYAEEGTGTQLHNNGNHCIGCEEGDGFVCNDNIHCPSCFQSARIHLS